MQLGGLLGHNGRCSSQSDAVIDSSVGSHDIVPLYSDLHVSGQSDPPSAKSKDNDIKRTFSRGSIEAMKGPNLKDALVKDALVRQMGVHPTTQNPNLFKDLLG
ncbi:hypothetical protein SAY86_029341 [Trapa natans]|uniref:Uncharacterized protein n=1 Tax=Trapa natans TaxID=22666 RepID=A0AAN7RCY4_TRANT|nr:hypothetical protein SAY86_029341 [Trapa natans]